MYETLILFHLIFGISWAGADIFLGLVLLPILARSELTSKEFPLAVLARIKPFLNASSGMAMLTGLGLLWVSGRFSDFWSPGTLLALLALLLVGAQDGYMQASTRKLRSLLEAGDEVAFRALVKRLRWLAVTIPVLVVVIMSGFAIGHM